MLGREDTEAGAQRAIEEWGESLHNSGALLGSLYRTNLLTEMGGSLFVIDIEAAELLGNEKHALAHQLAERPEAFLSLPFQQAINHFADRAIVSPAAFEAMDDAQRFRSFTMRRAASEAIVGRARNLLAASMLPEGPGLVAFVTSIAADEAALGFTVNSPFYLETVYRTATATSYNAGRLRAQKSPTIISAGGIWEYFTVQDVRVRDEHAELHGKQWEIGDAEAESVYPPNGYNCRCSMVVRDREDLDPAELDADVSDLTDDAITDGFRGPPDQVILNEAAAS